MEKKKENKKNNKFREKKKIKKGKTKKGKQKGKGKTKMKTKIGNKLNKKFKTETKNLKLRIEKITQNRYKLVRQRSYWRRSGEYVQRRVCFVNIQSSLHENVVFSVCACLGNAAYIIVIMLNSISGLDPWYHFLFNISCGTHSTNSEWTSWCFAALPSPVLRAGWLGSIV